MRIIGGKLKGIRIQTPGNLPVRPTTGLSKEALFNILNNKIDFEGIRVLDLFSGTGGISLEFASRGATYITAVDISYHCISFLKSMSLKFQLTGIHTIKADVFKFIRQQNAVTPYDVGFADAPFDHPKLNQLPEMIFARGLIKSTGILVIEHPSTMKFDHIPQFTEQRKYGYSSFSFFETGKVIY